MFLIRQELAVSSISLGPNDYLEVLRHLRSTAVLVVMLAILWLDYYVTSL
jgi:hypothetical protein